MKLPLPSPPRLLRPHVALTVETLLLADAALAELWDALTEIPIEGQTNIDGFTVIGFRETVKLFAALLSVESYLMPISEPILQCIANCDATGTNLPGLERAALALEFASSAIDTGLEALDRTNEDSGNAWHPTLTAASSVITETHGHLHCAIAGRGLAFGREWFTEN